MRRSVLIVAAVIAGAAASMPAADTAAAPKPTSADLSKAREARQKALECYGRKDWGCFRDRAREAHALDPVSTRLLYILACAEARNGDAAAAARYLDELLDRRVGWERGDDLAEIKSRPEMAPVLAKLAALKAPVSKSAVGFRLDEKDLVPEGIAFDPKTRAFFVSSVHHRKIIRRAADGTVTDFVSEGRDGLEAVLALRVDEKRGVLWAGSASLPEMRGWTEAADGASSLWAFDLATGNLLRRVRLDAPAGEKHALNDLAIAANGDVWATDSLAGGVYRWRAGRPASLETVVAPGILRSAQGIGFSPDGRIGYVSDWGEGIFLIDPGTGKLERMTGPSDVPLAGVDGLVVNGRDLLVTQNGIFPKRVARLTLDSSGRSVARGEVLEMSSPQMTEPTLGVVVRDGAREDFYFVGNAQWDAFDEQKKEFPPEKLTETVILKAPLPKPAR